MSLKTVENDINDAFDAITLSEQRIYQEAFDEGVAKGKDDGLKEGFHLGYHRGFELGYEIGFYLGVLSTLNLNTQDASPRIRAVYEKLKLSLDSVPDENNVDCDILKLVDSARASFKHLMSLLKLQVAPPSLPSITF